MTRNSWDFFFFFNFPNFRSMTAFSLDHGEDYFLSFLSTKRFLTAQSIIRLIIKFHCNPFEDQLVYVNLIIKMTWSSFDAMRFFSFLYLFIHPYFDHYKLPKSRLNFKTVELKKEIICWCSPLTGAAKTQVVTVGSTNSFGTKMALLLQNECRAPKFSQSLGSQ